MKTNQFRSLQQAALSVRNGTPAQINENVEIAEEEILEVSDELVEFVSNIIEHAEKELKTKFTAQEIVETTNFIVGKLQTESLIESIEEEVGFELNESEIQYVFETLENL